MEVFDNEIAEAQWDARGLIGEFREFGVIAGAKPPSFFQTNSARRPSKRPFRRNMNFSGAKASINRAIFRFGKTASLISG